jgi:DNA-binding GntR family transcriptional regulator
MNVVNQYRTMQEIAYDTIKAKILNGEYAPGERLITNDLANELGVSRMPIREALQRLDAATGLVTVIPHKGAVVFNSSDEDLYEVFLIRAVLEGLAARLACPNIDETALAELKEINQKIKQLHKEDEEYFQELNLEFYSIIWKASNAPRLVGMLKPLYEASRSYRYRSLKIPVRLNSVVQVHNEIIEAIEKQEPDRVESVIHNHYQHALDWLTQEQENKKAVQPEK